MTAYMSRIRAVVAAAVLFAGLTSCTSVDDNTGAGFIPGNQHFSIVTDSSFVINTYNITVDSTRADGVYSGHVGSYVDDKLGSATASLVFQMGIPFFGSESSNAYGPDVIIDSLSMVFRVEGLVGREGVTQTFEVYKLQDDIYVDSAYYTDFDPLTVIENEPYFTFDYTYDSQSAPNMIHKIYDPELIGQLSDTTGFFDNEEFHKRFRGFYIKPKYEGGDGAILTIDLNNSYLIAYCKKDGGVIPTLFLFSRTASHFTSYNQNIQIIDFDYASADPSLRINDTITPPTTTFIRSFGGMNTYMEFTEGAINTIKNRVSGTDFNHIAINRALLQIPVTRHSNEDMNMALSRLGMYRRFSDYVPIPDYDYESEKNYSYTLSYGGKLNHSKYMYEMDITSYVQAIFNGKIGTEKIVLGPDIDEMETFDYVELNSRISDNPLRLVLTYSMIK